MPKEVCPLIKCLWGRISLLVLVKETLCVPSIRFILYKMRLSAMSNIVLPNAVLTTHREIILKTIVHRWLASLQIIIQAFRYHPPSALAWICHDLCRAQNCQPIPPPLLPPPVVVVVVCCWGIYSIYTAGGATEAAKQSSRLKSWKGWGEGGRLGRRKIGR